jgi:sugar phosphate isomerase/epimerase
MTHWPIGVSTGCFYRQGILTVLDEIRSSGFHTIEIRSFPDHLDYHQKEDVRRAGERIQALGLRPHSFHAPFAHHIDITALDDAVREAAVGGELRRHRFDGGLIIETAADENEPPARTRARARRGRDHLARLLASQPMTGSETVPPVTPSIIIMP